MKKKTKKKRTNTYIYEFIILAKIVTELLFHNFVNTPGLNAQRFFGNSTCSAAR